MLIDFMFKYTYTDICIHTYIYIYINIYIHTAMHIHIPTQDKYAHTDICACIPCREYLYIQNNIIHRFKIRFLIRLFNFHI